MGLGTLLEKIINIITFGYGKRMATWVAKELGKDDCGCDERQDKLNKMFPYKVKGQPGSADSVHSVREETEKQKRLKRKFQKRV